MQAWLGRQRVFLADTGCTMTIGLNKEDKHGMKLEGLFGADLLERHGVLTDFAARKLWLRARGVK